jgi:hypothetical protein
MGEQSGQETKNGPKHAIGLCRELMSFSAYYRHLICPTSSFVSLKKMGCGLETVTTQLSFKCQAWSVMRDF